MILKKKNCDCIVVCEYDRICVKNLKIGNTCNKIKLALKKQWYAQVGQGYNVQVCWINEPLTFHISWMCIRLSIFLECKIDGQQPNAGNFLWILTSQQSYIEGGIGSSWHDWGGKNTSKGHWKHGLRKSWKSNLKDLNLHIRPKMHACTPWPMHLHSPPKQKLSNPQKKQFSCCGVCTLVIFYICLLLLYTRQVRTLSNSLRTAE